MTENPILIAGQWRPARTIGRFQAVDPSTGESLPDEYPISDWLDCDNALDAAVGAAAELRGMGTEKIALFLNHLASRIEARGEEIVIMASQETALPKTPRLTAVELPRTCGQLRQAATAAADGSWALPTIDTKLNIRSCHAPLGPVCVIGPNNFPLAFNGLGGGDFAAAIAAGNPVIVKGHPSHPGTTRLLAEEAVHALAHAGLPPATVQLLYHVRREDGLRLVSDHRIGATAFTGSRMAGLALKAAADAAGKPIYLEMSSLNPVVILPGAIEERSEKLADEFTDSCLVSGGQLCTKPGLLILVAGDKTESFLAQLHQRFASRAVMPLLSEHVGKGMEKSMRSLIEAGAKVIVGAEAVANQINRFANTLLRVDGGHFLKNSVALQTEAFGNASLAIIAKDTDQAGVIIDKLNGQLTGCIYSHTTGDDDKAYSILEPILRRRVGRLLNDKMPTGVAVTSAMNHGGPFPATGHPGFTAVGFPASIRRFSQLQCYDNVRPSRLPLLLRDKNPGGSMWRLIDGNWSTANIGQ